MHCPIPVLRDLLVLSWRPQRQARGCHVERSLWLFNTAHVCCIGETFIIVLGSVVVGADLGKCPEEPLAWPQAFIASNVKQELSYFCM